VRLNFSLGILAALQLVANLIAQLVVLALVGTGPQTDAYVAAQSVPLVVFAVLSVSLQAIWQPRLAVLHNDREAWHDAQGLAQGQATLVFGIVCTTLWITSPAWTPLMFAGFDSTRQHLTTSMGLPLFAACALNGHAALFTTALRARERFLIAESVALAATMGALCLIAITVPLVGVQAAAWVALGRAAVVCGVLYALCGRPVASPRGAWRDRQTWLLLRPLVAGSSLYKTAPLVDRFWTSQGMAGTLTVYNLAQTAMGALAVVIERAVCMPVGPRLARIVERGEWTAVRAAYRRCIVMVTWIAVATAIALLSLKPWWNSLLALALKMDAQLATSMWWTCVLLLGYLHVAASGTVATATFYAMGDTKTPVKIGILGFLIGVVLKSFAFVTCGLPGLALATSSYYAGNMIAMFIILERRVHARLA
jgi:peptidoglycan biosynthesis protein MviN/MurJ (putative lipid II flippase)